MRTRARISVVIFAIGAVMANGCAQATHATAAPDSTASLQAKFDALKSGQTLRLDRITYAHSGVLRIRVPNVTIDGNGATLQATQDATSSVQVTASNVRVTNLRLLNNNGGRRWDALDQQALVVRGTNGVTLSGVTVDGSAAAGIFVDGSSGFTITDARVNNTRADGIHMTGGSGYGQVIRPVTTQTGDDGVAVVSYSDSPPNHDISVLSPVVNGTRGGRGISVVGGTRISYSNITVRDSFAAGVYIATESGYNVQSVNTVSVLGGTVTRADYSPAVVTGAVLVYSGSASRSVTGVTLSGLSVVGTPTSAQRAVGVLRDAGSMSGITLSQIKLSGSSVQPFVSNARGTYQATAWTLNGAPYSVS